MFLHPTRPSSFRMCAAAAILSSGSTVAHENLYLVMCLQKSNVIMTCQPRGRLSAAASVLNPQQLQLQVTAVDSTALSKLWPVTEGDRQIKPVIKSYISKKYDIVHLMMPAGAFALSNRTRWEPAQGVNVEMVSHTCELLCVHVQPMDKHM